MTRNLLSDSRIPYILLGLLSLFPLLALTSPTNLVPNHQRDTPKRDVELEECGFRGDDNTYGLGIRLGVYFQWVTSSIAYNLVPEEAITMRGVNNCFQAAMFAGLLFITITKGSELYAVEAFIMLMFCMGGVCSGDAPGESDRLDRKAKRFAYYGASKMGSLIRFTLGAGFCAYGVWFTFRGMDNMKHPSCSTFAFFFARVNLYNWFRTFWKVVFIIGASIYGTIVVFGGFGLLVGGWKLLTGHAKLSLSGHPADNGSEFDIPNTSKSNIAFSTALVLFIIGVELMIKWNHIQGVNDIGSTGQLLPLIIGVGGTFRVVYRLFSKVLQHRA